MEIQPDIIVVGAGSAGCAMARRLADNSIRVLLAEAGKTDRTLRSRIPALVGGVVNDPDFDWSYKAEPDPTVGGRQDVWPAGKRLGGGSAINGMMFIRGHRHDYDRWAELGASGWDYASVLPYFRRLEDNDRGKDEWRGVGGPIAVSAPRSMYPIAGQWIEAVKQAGYPRSTDLNGEHAEGADYVQLSQKGGLRCSAARGYLADAPSNLEVMLETQVLRIVVEQGRAVGIEVAAQGGRRFIRANAGVVVSAGTMNTPRLLMLSGIGPATHLAEHGIEVIADLQGVGANLQEHVGTHLVNEVAAHTLNNDARGWRAVAQLGRFVLHRSGALTTGIGHAHAFVRTREGLDAPNVHLAFSAFAFDVNETGNVVMRQESSIATFIALVRPSSRGSIRLADASPWSPPRIEHQLLGSDDDLEQLVEGVELARRVLEQPAIAGLVTSEVRPGVEPHDRAALREHVRMASLPMYHPVGTARMGGTDDPYVVVDADLRVRGIEGLWVADASIMPSLPAGNTNATAIMIGDKGADHVLRSIA